MKFSHYGKSTAPADEPRAFPAREALRKAIQQAKDAGEIIVPPQEEVPEKPKRRHSIIKRPA